MLRDAVQRFTAHQYDQCKDICTKLLDGNAYDQAAWYLKTRSITEISRAEDFEDSFDAPPPSSALDDGIKAPLPRPGTSLRVQTPTSIRKPSNASQDPAAAFTSPAIRPMSQGGRILTGYSRPMTSARDFGNPGSKPVARSLLMTSAGHVMSSSGRMIRLGTASLVSEPGGPFVDVEKLDLKKYAQRPNLSRALFEYIYTHCRNTRKALELASHATEACGFKDWWWKLQTGKCFMRLREYRDAERQLKSSLKDQDMLITRMYLARIYICLDQPTMALQVYTETAEKYPHSTSPLIGIARLHEELEDLVESANVYKKVRDCFF
ncbi:Tetratricopeptide repeat protein 8 [Chytridiales sp. JEL 0842]|nr:Tetratricopeptide repeat protein 8 [Chytridiales sp. JEL 0842]